MQFASQHSRLSRRRLLQIGGLGGLAFGLPQLLRAEQTQRQTTGKPLLRSCILVFYYGGPSQLETWDPKPDAPREVRGMFETIETSTPGLRIGEHLPHCAKVMHHLAIVRSMHHPMRQHNAAAVEALCGRTPLRGDLELLANDPATDFPCFGSAVARTLTQSAAAAVVPPYVALPHVMYNVVMLPGQTAGFLGASYEPLRIESDPNQPNFSVPELELPANLTVADLESRQRLLDVVDSQAQSLEQQQVGAAALGLDGYYDRAFALLHSPAVRQALDLGAEAPALRDKYGRTRHGQSMLLARRLVEAGVRFVSVYDHVRNGLENWDTHVDNFSRLKDQLLPPTDRGLAALVTDLAERGLLESTLVVALGEFGRTPKINPNAGMGGGRDHWPDCYSVVLAGGGATGGAIYGESDKHAAYPARDPATPGDLAATIFWRFGIDPTQNLYDASGRAYRLAEGQPLTTLFG